MWLSSKLLGLAYGRPGQIDQLHVPTTDLDSKITGVGVSEVDFSPPHAHLGNTLACVHAYTFSPPHAHIGNTLACACPQTFNYTNLRWCGIQGPFFCVAV